MFATLSTLLLLLLAGSVPVVVMLVIGRRIRSAERLRREHDVVAAILTVLGAIYGVLLAFIVTTVWTQYSHTLEICESEGSCLANLHRDSYCLPLTNQVPARQALINYAQVVINDEWPALARQKDSPKATAAMNHIWREYYTVRPVTETEKIWLQESVARLNELAHQRRLRTLAAQDSLSWLLWVLLVFGGVIVISFVNLFGVERFRSHLFLTLSLACLIVMILHLIHEFDNPFEGEPHIAPTSFERFLQHHPTPE
jgi:hypothetical protein